MEYFLYTYSKTPITEEVSSVFYRPGDFLFKHSIPYYIIIFSAYTLLSNRKFYTHSYRYKNKFSISSFVSAPGFLAKEKVRTPSSFTSTKASVVKYCSSNNHLFSSSYYAQRLINIAQINPVNPIIVSIIVHDFKVVFSSISSNEFTSQNPESFT